MTPRRRRALVLAALVAVTLVALEIGARGALALLAARGGSGLDGLEARRIAIAAGDPAADQAARTLTRDALPHPYLGYVQIPGRRDEAWLARHGLPVDALGFIDDGEPLPRRSPDTAIVGITGGSVAFYFSMQGVAALERELRRIPAFANKRIEIRRFALGGWKQPQQLLALQYLLALGGELDLLINLDGHNEVEIYPRELAASAQPPSFPRGWAELVGNDFSPRRRNALGALAAARERRTSWAQTMSAALLDRSALATSLWWLVDRALERRVGEALDSFRRVAAEEMELPGPRTTFANESEMLDALVDLWARSSRLLSGAAAAQGIRYFHFLQPSQYAAGAKPMSDAERQVAIENSDVARYLGVAHARLRARGAALREEGVAFTDLTDVFAGVEDPLYVDTCCHVSQRGNEILGTAIGRAIVGEYQPRP